MKGLKMPGISFQKSAETEGLQFCKNILEGTETNPHTKKEWFDIIEMYSTEAFAHLPTPLTKEAAFSRALDTPFGVAAYQVLKRSPGLDVAPVAAEEPVDIAKADAARRGTANSQMLELARLRRQAFPSLSSEQAFTQVWESRENLDLKNRALEENWDAVNSGVGNTEFRNSPAGQAVGYASAYRNPHPTVIGSPKPSTKSDNQVPRPGFDLIADPTPGRVSVSPGRA